MNADAGLIVRRNERHELALPARFAVAEPHAGALRYTPAVAQSAPGWIDCDLIDFSGGGLGVVSSVFVPHNARLVVRVYREESRERPILEAPVRVQRTVMTDRRPAYLVGTAFEDLAGLPGEQVDEMLTLLSGHGD